VGTRIIPSTVPTPATPGRAKPAKEASAHMSGNIQNKLRQVRKPRVHITLDVESEGQVKKELPFVMGVMGDFSGDPRKPLPSFAERGFVTIDRDNFDTVMTRMNPGLSLKVDNKLSDDGSQVGVDLAFSSMEDFSPARVAEQVPQLKALMETRAKLRDLLAKADRSEELENLLEQILQRDDDLKSVSADLSRGPDKE
jgi:type VI secretion system protein ImpB